MSADTTKPATERSASVDWHALVEQRERELKEAKTELHRLRAIEQNASEYQCPTCARCAPWTDGELAADCGEDWFWCQTCAAETPLSAMTSRIADLRPVHYRDAADSLRKTAAHRLDTAPDAVAYARAEGINEAAGLLENTLKDLEGDTDA